MKKIIKFISIVLTFVMVCGMFACTDYETGYNETPAPSSTQENVPAEKTTVRVTALKGPTGMGMAKLFKDSDNNSALNKYEKTIESDPTLVSAAVLFCHASRNAPPPTIRPITLSR